MILLEDQSPPDPDAPPLGTPGMRSRPEHPAGWGEGWGSFLDEVPRVDGSRSGFELERINLTGNWIWHGIIIASSEWLISSKVLDLTSERRQGRPRQISPRIKQVAVGWCRMRRGALF